MSAEDLFEIANGFDNSLLMLKEKNRKDLKRRFTINVNLPIADFHNLDQDLYITQNGSKDGFVPSEEIRAKILGLDFVITSEDEEPKES